MVDFELCAPTSVGFQLAPPPALGVEFDVVIATVGGPPYTGAYEVTPRIFAPVTLPTKDKTLKDDVTVLKIPQYEVANEAGGNTLIMGDDLYG